jgi:hypothetical protein
MNIRTNINYFTKILFYITIIYNNMEFEKVNSIDSRLVNEMAKVEMQRGPASVSKNVAAVTGGTVNLNALQWNIPITSSGLAVDTRWYIEYELNITVPVTIATSVVAGGSPILSVGTNICLDAYPLSSLMGQSSVLINEKQVCSYDISQYRQLLLRTIDSQKLNPDQTFPSLVEQGIAFYPSAYLTRANPMSSYADADFGASFVPNGSYPITFSAENTAGANIGDVVNITCNVKGFEPLLLSPCNWNSSKENDESCPFYVRNIQINCPLSSLNRFFRFNTGVSSGTTTFTVGTPVFATGIPNPFPTANLHYFTLAPPLLEGYRLPSQSIHHTYDIVTNSISAATAFTGGPAAETKELQLTNQNLSGMPTYIVLGAMKDKNAYTADQASFFFPITKLVISNSNTQNILASYNAVDLFNMSRKNGLKTDYVSFTGSANVVSYTNAGVLKPSALVQTCSAPIIINVKDLELPYNVTNSSSGNFVFNFTATVANSEFKVAGTYLNSVPILKAMFIYDEWIVSDSQTLLTDIKRSFLSPSAPLESAPIKADNEEVNEVVGGTLHKMKSYSKGASNNISKSQAVAKLSKRLAY